MKFYNWQNFQNVEDLIRLKVEQGVTIGVALPVCNEEKTIGKTIEVVRSCGSLIDQVIALDSASHDESALICRQYGVPFFKDAETAEEMNVTLERGKGWNLWSSLYHLNTDIVLWLDSDIQNIDQRFILGLAGPLLRDPRIDFVKGCYTRPKGDARVTELMARPLISLLFPELKDFIQPLSGEYGGRRKILERMKFYSGYSVEMALLIQAVLTLPQDKITQVYLGERIHKLQDIPSLGKMSANILFTVTEMAHQLGRIGALPKSDRLLRQYDSVGGCEFKTVDIGIVDKILPPIATIPKYIEKMSSR